MIIILNSHSETKLSGWPRLSIFINIFCQSQPFLSSITYLMVLVLSRVFHIKPSSLTSHMANLRHGWYPTTRSFFATLKEHVQLHTVSCWKV
jgi:hypothetical protein